MSGYYEHQFKDFNRTADYLQCFSYLINDVIDGPHGGCVSNCVTDPHTEAVLQQPVVHSVLSIVQKAFCCIRALLHPYDVNQARSCFAQCALAERACQQLPILNQDLGANSQTGVTTIPTAESMRHCHA